MKKIILILLAIIPFLGVAQKDSITIDDDFEELVVPVIPEPSIDEAIFEVVEQMPEFHGGQDSLALFISKHLRYPKGAEEFEKEGKVYIKFVVEPDGRITNPRVLKTFDSECSKEALRVIKLTSGKWKPGTQRGKPVRVNVVQPVTFKLSEATPQTKEPDEVVYQMVETMPKYPGGDEEMYKFISKHLKYPKKARNNEIEGKVFVQFMIDKEGNVTRAKVLKGIGYGCDEEALRVVNKMPKWKPGTQRGKPVPVMFTLPFNFKLK
jgi:TonB family protein